MKKILIALVLTFAISPTAFAHSSLIEAKPASNAQEAQFPSEISLSFNEKLLTLGTEKTNSISLISPNGASVELGSPVVTNNVITADVLTPPSETGDYTVRYRVVSGDGHPIEGSYSFSYSSGGSTDVTTPVTTSVKDQGIEENGETPKALLIFVLLAGLALLAYRRFLGRK